MPYIGLSLLVMATNVLGTQAVHYVQSVFHLTLVLSQNVLDLNFLVSIPYRFSCGYGWAAGTR